MFSLGIFSRVADPKQGVQFGDYRGGRKHNFVTTKVVEICKQVAREIGAVER